MSGPTELLILRLALIGVIFIFVAIVAVSLNGSVGRRAPAAAAPGPRTARLVVLRAGETGLPRGTQFVLAGVMVVGRDAEAGIVLSDSSVSTQHASIERVNGSWLVSDLGSTNGTFVEGKQVGRAGANLRPRGQVTFGNVVLQLLVD
jgi:hypothetical protein